MNKINTSVKQNKKTLLFVIIGAILALVLCIAANAITGFQKAEATPSLANLQATLDKTSDDYFEALHAKDEAQAKVNEAQATIEKCEKEIPEVQAKLAVRAKSMYTNQGFSEVLSLLLGASSITELVNNIEAITIMSNKDSALIKSCQDLKAQVESEKDALEANLAEASNQASIAEEAYQTAQDTLAQAEAAAAAEQAAREQQEGGGGDKPHPTPGPAPAPAPYLGDVVSTANACLGYPYVWGAAGPNGFDCSGLVSWCYGGGGSHIFTTYTFVNQEMGFRAISASEAVPGDVVSTSGHCGIYIGGGQMIHAPQTGDVVKISGVQSGMGYYRKG